MFVEKICPYCNEAKPPTSFRQYRKKCKQCQQKDVAAWQKNNKEKVKENQKKHYYKNYESRMANARKQNAKKVGVPLTEEQRNKNKARGKRHYEANKTQYHMKSLFYKMRKAKAMPSFANKFYIEEIYSLARLRTKVTGFQWDVDHIIPLKGEKVCGLHVEWNLRVIPHLENIKKGNRICL